MPIDDFIIAVFCLIDEEKKKILQGKKLRQRGPAPGLADNEVITMEIVGEFLGKDCDKAIWEYFKSHWLHFFPKIPDRSNFVRQAANLHVVKRMVQESLAFTLCAFGDSLHIVVVCLYRFVNLLERILVKSLKVKPLMGIVRRKKNIIMAFVDMS